MSNVMDSMLTTIEMANTADFELSVAEWYAEMCKSYTHIDTGRLINSYKVYHNGKTAVVKNDTPYAATCEYTHQHFMFHKAKADLENKRIWNKVIDEALIGGKK